VANATEQANAGATVVTTLDVQRVKEIAEASAAGIRGTGVPKRWAAQVTVVVRAENGLKLRVGSQRQTGVDFDVLTKPTETGGTKVTVTIKKFVTVQDKVMGISASQKKIVMFDFYRQYLIALGEAIRDADRSADIQIVG
jgi:hypothetical protein